MTTADWTDEATYAALAGLDASALAWEFLRRNQAYRAAWRSPGAAASFGLAAPIDPAIGGREAAPVWRPEAAPGVAVQMISGGVGPATARRLQALAAQRRSLGAEVHLRFPNGLQATFSAAAAAEAPLAALVPVDHALAARMGALRALRAGLAGRWLDLGAFSPARRRRLAGSLRALDGRAAGASYRDLVNHILSVSILQSTAWRSSPARARVIRLCAAGRDLVAGGYLRLLGGGRSSP